MQRFLDQLDELEGAIDRLQPELDNMRTIIGRTRQHLATGASLERLYTAGDAPAARDVLITRLNDVQSALKRSRAEYIRVLVDDDKMTIPQVARLIGHPAQLVRRLYQTTHRDPTIGG